MSSKPVFQADKISVVDFWCLEKFSGKKWIGTNIGVMLLMGMMQLKPLLFEGMVQIPPELLKEIRTQLTDAYYQYNQQLLLSFSKELNAERISKELLEGVNLLVKKYSDWFNKSKEYEDEEAPDMSVDISHLSIPMVDNYGEVSVVGTMVFQADRFFEIMSKAGDKTLYSKRIYRGNQEPEALRAVLEEAIREIKDSYEQEHIPILLETANELKSKIVGGSLDRSFFWNNKPYDELSKTWGVNLTVKLLPELFSNWNIGNKQMDLGKFYQFLSKPEKKLYIKCTFDREASDSLGVYHGYGPNGNAFALDAYCPRATLSVNANEMLGNIQIVLEQGMSTIEHELIHFVQEILYIAVTGMPILPSDGVTGFKSQEKFGRPPKTSREKTGGSKTVISPETSWRGAWMHKHEDRDIEFYTRLNDEMLQLKKSLDSLWKRNEGKMTEVFKNYVGVGTTNIGSYWLKYLKDNNLKKYNKAVKELYKWFLSYLKNNVSV